VGLRVEVDDRRSIQGKLESRRSLLQTVRELEKRMEILEDTLIDLKRTKPPPDETGPSSELDIVSLLLLPDHLRKTMITLSEMGQATAAEIAEKTERVRNLESSYLNQLARMGLIDKFRERRHTYFVAKEADISSIQGALTQLRREEKIDEKVVDEIARLYNLPKDRIPKWLTRR
jgi:hypothetical protein